jgi:UDP-glucose 4-epimerase
MANVVVTGGAGFIGSHLVEALLARGHHVTVLDDLSTGCRANLDGAPSATFHEGSVLDATALREVTGGADFVFHLAAIPSVPRSLREPLLTHAVNATGTLMVLEACRGARVSRVIYAASSSAQGDLGDQPRSEWLSARPRSPYAVAKYAGELYGQMYHEVHGLPVVSLRYFNVYGPRQRLRGEHSNVIPAFLAAGLQGGAATIYGDGLQTRDFTYVADIVRGSLLAMEAPQAPGHTINLGSGRAVTVRRLAELAGSALGSSLAVEYAPARSGDVYCIRTDLSRAGQLLGYVPMFGLEDGLRQTLAWVKEQMAAKSG